MASAVTFPPGSTIRAVSSGQRRAGARVAGDRLGGGGGDDREAEEAPGHVTAPNQRQSAACALQLVPAARSPAFDSAVNLRARGQGLSLIHISEPTRPRLI
eukprot:3934444-Rhodomonas_salina.1